MQQRRLWLPLAITIAAACGGGENTGKGTTSNPAPPPASSTAAAPATRPAEAISGKTWDVRMLGDAAGYRFEPRTLTIKRGDGVRWTNVSGGPHNVTFWPDSIPQGAQATLAANMPQPMSPLTGPLLTQPSQTYTISFGGAPAGVYHYYCTPHLAMGMTGSITVQ